MYKKHHWQIAGQTFYQLHLLFDKHYNEQVELVDALAERIMSLGGVSIAMAHDVAEATRIPHPPKGPTQITRLLNAHEMVLEFTRKAAREIVDNSDDGTNDLLVSHERDAGLVPLRASRGNGVHAV
jgi:starvation-inducible DNA-binding protein